MIYLIAALVVGCIWLDYEIRDPHGRLYDTFHGKRG